MCLASPDEAGIAKKPGTSSDRQGFVSLSHAWPEVSRWSGQVGGGLRSFCAITDHYVTFPTVCRCAGLTCPHLPVHPWLPLTRRRGERQGRKHSFFFQRGHIFLLCHFTDEDVVAESPLAAHEAERRGPQLVSHEPLQPKGPEG